MGSADLPGWWAQVRRVKNPTKRELTLFMLLSGLRSKDARTAKWEHLEEERGALFIPEPKGGSSRAFSLPISNEMLACIHRARESWLAAEDPSKFIFLISPFKRRVSTTDARAHFVDEGGNARKAKSGHDLRRTFANLAAEAGVPLKKRWPFFSITSGAVSLPVIRTPQPCMGSISSRRRRFHIISPVCWAPCIPT